MNAPAAAAPGVVVTWRRLAGWLAPYLAGHKRAFTLVGAAQLTAAGLGLVPPLLARRLVDDVLVARQVEALWSILGTGLAVSLAGAALAALGGWVHARATADVLAAARAGLLGHLLDLPPATRHGLRPGDLMSRLVQDVAEVQRTVVDAALGAVTATLTGAAAFAMLCWLEWRLALLCLAAGPVLAIATAKLRPWTLESARAMRERGGEGMAFLADALAGATHVQAHGLQPAVLGRYAGLNERFLATLLQERVRAGVARAVPAVLLGGVAAAVLGWGGLRVAAGALSAGALVAFAAYVWRFFGPLRGLAGLGLRLQAGLAALERVEALLALPPLPAPAGDAPPAGPWGLVVADLGYAYDPERPVLHALGLAVPAGRTTAIVGPSGAGKSTLLHVLLGLAPGWTGRVQVNGVDLAGLDLAAWRARIAWVAPDAPPLHGTIAENLRVGAPGASDDAVAAALAVVDLAELVAGLPEGLNTVVGERGMRFSGGQRQRLMLAAALLRDPELLVLDEATGALDAPAEAAIWERLAAARAGRTTLLVTHRQALARSADHVVVLAAGRVVQAGEPAAVLPPAGGPGPFGRRNLAPDVGPPVDAGRPGAGPA